MFNDFASVRATAVKEYLNDVFGHNLFSTYKNANAKSLWKH